MLKDIFNARLVMRLVILIAFIFMGFFALTIWLSNSEGMKAYREIKVGTIDGSVGTIDAVSPNPFSRVSQEGEHYTLPVIVSGSTGKKKMWVEIQGDGNGKWEIIRESDADFRIQ